MTDGRKKGNPKPKAPVPDEKDEEEELSEGPTLESQFVAFVKYGNPDNPGTHITLSQIDFWLKQAGVLQVRKLTRTDTGVCYFYFRKYQLNFEEFKEFLELLANRKKLPVEEIQEKLIQSTLPVPEEDSKKIINK